MQGTTIHVEDAFGEYFLYCSTVRKQTLRKQQIGAGCLETRF